RARSRRSRGCSSTPDRSPSPGWAHSIISRLAGKTWSAEYLRLEHRQPRFGVAPGARPEHALARERLPETLGGPLMVQGHLRQQEPGVAAHLEVGAMNAQAELLHPAYAAERREHGDFDIDGSRDRGGRPEARIFQRRRQRQIGGFFGQRLSALAVPEATEQFFALVQAHETAAPRL